MVFGHVVEGMDVVHKVEALGSANGKPRSRVRIASCGVVDAAFDILGGSQTAEYFQRNL